MKASTPFYSKTVPAGEGWAQPELLLFSVEWKRLPFGGMVQAPGRYFSLALISEECELSHAKPTTIVTE